jgi:putative membrane protein
VTARRIARIWAAATLLVFAGVASALPDTKAAVAPTDATFMQHAAADGMAEVQMGQMALDKASNASLKELAQRVVDDHTKANDQLKALAAGKQVALPAAPDANAQKESKKLDALDGGAFDKAWSKAMVDAHKKAVKLFTAEGKATKDQDMRKFAQTTLPMLQTHLQMATQVAAIPDARDKAMDQAMKSSMSDTSSPMTAVPATATPTTVPPASTIKSTTPPASKSH